MLITLKKAEHPSHSTTSSAYDYYIPSSQGRMQSLIGMTNSFGASHSLLFVLQMQTVQFPIVPVWWTFLESAVEPDGIRLCGKWKKMDVHILVFIYSNTSALPFFCSVFLSILFWRFTVLSLNANTKFSIYGTPAMLTWRIYASVKSNHRCCCLARLSRTPRPTQRKLWCIARACPIYFIPASTCCVINLSSLIRSHVLKYFFSFTSQKIGNRCSRMIFFFLTFSSLYSHVI